MKKENQNLKDSNENHIFINEKLNQALKKSSKRIEELEKKFEESGLPSSSTKDNNTTKNSINNGKTIVDMT